MKLNLPQKLYWQDWQHSWPHSLPESPCIHSLLSSIEETKLTSEALLARLAAFLASFSA